MATAPFGDQPLVRKDGSTVSAEDAFAGKKYVLFYHSASWCPPCRAFTPRLSEWYTAHKDDADKEVEIVFVSGDRDEASFKEYFRHMSFDLAVAPDTPANDNLSRLHEVEGIPTLVVVDAATGEIITKDGREGVAESPEGLPWRPRSIIDILSGCAAFSAGPGSEETVSWAALQEVEVLGLYFSGHWCGPCRAFTPKLADWYSERAGMVLDKKMDIVFVSSDRDEGSFNGYRGEMPWKALPFAERAIKGELSSRLDVQGIPTLVLIDPRTGEVLCSDARSKVEEAPDAFPWPPTAVTSLEGASDYINKVLTIVAFTDMLTDAAAEVAVNEAVSTVAADYFPERKGEIRFAVAPESDGMVDPVRGFCGATKDKAGETACRVVAIDVRNRRVATLPPTEVPTEESLRAFVEGALGNTIAWKGIAEARASGL